MKLVIFGLTVSSSWGNGHATLWRGLLRSFARRGHDVVFFERDVPYYSNNRDLTELPGGELVLYSGWDEAAPLAARHLREADVGMVTSYCPDAAAATRFVLDGRDSLLRTFYDLDTPVTLDRLSVGEPVAYIGERGLRDFDFVLSYTGGRALTELRERLGARSVRALYGSVDPEVHRPVPADERFRADVSYLGTYAADRQAALEELFIEPARRLPRRKFLIGGAQYPQDFPWTRNIYFVRHIAPPEHPAFYSSSGFTVNVTRAAMREMGYCPSGRLFEAAACGVPVVSDSWEGLDEFFIPGEEIIVARTSDDAIRAFDMSEAERLRISERARRRALDEHTADRRAEELEQALGGAMSDKASVTPRSDGEREAARAAAEG